MKLSTFRRGLGATAAAAVFVTGLLPVVAGGSAPQARADGCADIDVVVARGTAEPGDLGSEIGDPLFAVLQQTLPGSVSGYRVDYPADLLNTDSVGDGSADLVGHLIGTADACPATRFVIVGYSQGAVVVHTSLGTDITANIPGATQLPGEYASRIAAILLFGDPMRLIGDAGLPGPYQDRMGSWCLDGDPVCELGGGQPSMHVAYGSQLAAAASFAAARL